MRQQKPIVKNCALCGNEFIAPHYNTIYCSSFCKTRMNHLQNAKHRKPGSEILDCAVCGKKFVGYPQDKACSIKCKNILLGLPEPELPEGELPKLDKLSAEQLYNYADIQKKHYADTLKVTIPEGLVKAKDRLNKT